MLDNRIKSIQYEDCGDCEHLITYTVDDINENGQIKCPECGSMQNPCAACLSFNKGCELVCNKDHLERVDTVRKYMTDHIITDIIRASIYTDFTPDDGNVQQHSFLIGDTFGYLDEYGMKNHVIEIDTIFVPKEERRQKKGSTALKELLATITDEIVVTSASALMREYPEEPTKEQYTDLFKKLDKFYTSCGFTDVNNILAGYEYKVVYLYTGNEVGKQFYEKLQKSHAEYQAEHKKNFPEE